MCRNFYWLNCVRFFSGCYSKGELHSLVDRLENLLEDDVYKYLAHPRDLAVLLLSDWVFSQFPRSINKVVSLLFKDGGVRFLGNGIAGRSSLIRDTVKLPEGCGREKLIESCRKELLEIPAVDYAQILTDLIKENSTDEECRQISLEFLAQSENDNFSFHMRNIRDIGGFKHFNNSELSRIEDQALIKSDFYEAVSQSGRNDYLFMDSARLEEAMGQHLSGRIVVNPDIHEHTDLGALFLFLEPAFFNFILSQAPVFDKDTSQPLNTWLGNFMGVSFSDSKESSRSENRDVSEILSVYRKEFDRQTKTWMVDISPHENIIQCLWQKFGCAPKIVKMACVAAGIKNKELQCREASDLFDSSCTLVRRVRYARLRAGSVSWWSEIFERSKNDEQHVLAVIVFLLWSSKRTLSTLLYEFDESVKAISQASVKGILRASIRDRWLDFSNSKKLSFNKGLTKLAEEIGGSTISLLSSRFDKNARLELVDLVVGGYDFDSPEDWRLVMNVITESLKDSSSSSHQLRCLDAISKCYLRCRSELAPPFGYQRYVSVDSILSSKKVARHVMDNVESLPVFLVLQAEAYYRHKVSRDITPVLDLSNQERWFSF